MNQTEAMGTIAAINMFWPRPQLDARTSAMWAAVISEFDRETVKNALHRMAKSHKWRPSLAEIVAEVRPEAGGETAFEAFEAVRKCLSHPAAKRRGLISAKAYQAVQRIGGWAYVGRWQVDQMHHHQRLFSEAYGDVTARHDDNARLGLPAPGDKPHKAIGAAVRRAMGKGASVPELAPEPVSGHSRKPEGKQEEPDEDERKRVADLASSFLERLKRG